MAAVGEAGVFDEEPAKYATLALRVLAVQADYNNNDNNNNLPLYR